MPLPDLDRLRTVMQFPAMTFLETRLTRLWIERHAAEWDAVEWNFRLGDGITLPETVDEATRRAARALTQKRADLIVTTRDVVGIVEVKHRIAPHALGQLLVYRDLWRAQDPLARPVRMIVIGREITPDVESTLRTHGVEIEVFPEVGLDLQAPRAG